jgi:hypothetical protein
MLNVICPINGYKLLRIISISTLKTSKVHDETLDNLQVERKGKSSPFVFSAIPGLFFGDSVCEPCKVIAIFLIFRKVYRQLA